MNSFSRVGGHVGAGFQLRSDNNNSNRLSICSEISKENLRKLIKLAGAHLPNCLHACYTSSPVLWLRIDLALAPGLYPWPSWDGKGERESGLDGNRMFDSSDFSRNRQQQNHHNSHTEQPQID